MKFILHSEIDAAYIRDNLGKPEYSYYFVLKAFLPAFERLGTVELVRNPAEDVDRIYEACVASGEDCVFVSFSPPHLVALGLKCPTILVIAWEFSSLPDGSWAPDDPRQDWRYVFGKLRCVVSLSTHTAHVVKVAMGEDFPIFAIPAPIYDRIPDLTGPTRGGEPLATTLRVRGAVFDSRDYELSPDKVLTPTFPFPLVRPTASEEAAAREREEAEARKLEQELAAACRAEEEALADAVTRPGLRFRLAVTKRHLLEWYREVVRDLLPAALARLVGRIGGWGEIFYRRLIGEHSLPPPPPPPPLPPELEVSLRGVIYTAVLNPTDGRKNWHDILTAFCWAFRDVEDATLVLKMIKSDPTSYRRDLFFIMCRLAPFKCRVVTVDGFLDNAEYNRLIGLTNYYVNASSAEGLCMPLMEFMSAGKPAIAPRHTAFADYVDDSAVFIVKATPELTVWPVDPAHRYSTMCQRIHWETLVAAFEQSYRLATEAAPQYSKMGSNAADAMRRYCSDEAVTARVRVALDQVLGTGSGQSEKIGQVPLPQKSGVPVQRSVLEAGAS
jgi:glycosyltransferase involved in cell wall biosynthesis